MEANQDVPDKNIFRSDEFKEGRMETILDVYAIKNQSTLAKI